MGLKTLLKHLKIRRHEHHHDHHHIEQRVEEKEDIQQSRHEIENKTTPILRGIHTATNA